MASGDEDTNDLIESDDYYAWLGLSKEVSKHCVMVSESVFTNVGQPILNITREPGNSIGRPTESMNTPSGLDQI